MIHPNLADLWKMRARSWRRATGVRLEMTGSVRLPRVKCGVRRLVSVFSAGTTCRPSSTASSGAPHNQDARVIAMTLIMSAEPRMLSGLCLSDLSLRRRKRRQVSALQRVTAASSRTRATGQSGKVVLKHAWYPARQRSLAANCSPNVATSLMGCFPSARFAGPSRKETARMVTSSPMISA